MILSVKYSFFLLLVFITYVHTCRSLLTLYFEGFSSYILIYTSSLLSFSLLCPNVLPLSIYLHAPCAPFCVARLSFSNVCLRSCTYLCYSIVFELGLLLSVLDLSPFHIFWIFASAILDYQHVRTDFLVLTHVCHLAQRNPTLPAASLLLGCYVTNYSLISDHIAKSYFITLFLAIITPTPKPPPPSLLSPSHLFQQCSPVMISIRGLIGRKSAHYSESADLILHFLQSLIFFPIPLFYLHHSPSPVEI